jgi:hypothetical protein
MYDFRHQKSSQAPTEFPANLLAETTATEFVVVGADLTAGNKAYYRVVAVDEKGNLSGASDYAAVPRPAIYSRPVEQARVGVDYQYDVQVIRSLGDVRMRIVQGKEMMNFWDVERPKFQIERGPTWLTIDPESGRLTGNPDQTGPAEVVVAVTLERAQRSLDPAQLQWGVEKVIAAGIEATGTAQQTFVIEVDSP